MLGTTLGPYRVDAELGAGGMGRVFAATVEGRAPGLAEGTVVALKVVHPHLLETPGFFKRFLREAQIGKTVVHENVVTTYDCDSVLVGGSRIDFLVMEYVEGQTLRELLAELDRVPEELCRHIGREVSKGLAAIHAAGVVHRDMKPENVLITKEHVVKVMDLGVARLFDEALRLSQTGAFVGSIHYAAPECFSDGGKHLDGRADLHALGLVLYELSCGTNPYYADSVPEILKKVLHEAPRRLGDVNPQLSPFFEEVVHALLAKDREKRIQTAVELAQLLDDGERSEWWKSRAKAIRAVTHRPMRRIRIPRETAVYGRDVEIAKLRALYEKAKSGEGQVVVVEGEAGIGKSRVVDELIGRLQRDGEDLNFLFGSYPPGGAATASGAFSTAYREQFGEAGAADYLAQTPALVPAFNALLRGETTPSGVEPLTKDSLQTVFVHATRNLAAERTTIVLIDDLHFAPEEGRALFAALAMAVPGRRILLVGTTRPGVDEKWLAGLDRVGAARVSLPRLGAKDLVRLLADTLRSEHLATELSGQIAMKSDGNPFFVFEILRGLREGQFITKRDDGTWVSTRVIAEIQIPSSVLELVNARVADLSEDERSLLDVAACWGFEFDPVVVGDVLGLARIPLLRSLARIERRHRLVRASGRTYVFDHHQVQEALYGLLSVLLREEYHAALASALESRTNAAGRDPATLEGALCVRLCDQFLSGAQGERALRYLAGAQTHLEKTYLNHAAVQLADRALAAPGLLAGADRAKALLRLCAVSRPLDRLGRRSRQEEASREAERLAEAVGDEDLRGQAASALGWCLYQTSRLAEAESSLRRALEIALSRGDKKAEGAAENGLGSVFWSQGRLAQAREHYERCLAIHHEIGSRQGEATATSNLGTIAWAQGRHAQAREHHERHLALSREIGDREGEASATGNLGAVFYSQGRHAQAREQFERCLAISREIGFRSGEAVALHNLGSVLSEEGETAPARARLVESLSLSGEIGYRPLVAETQLILGALHMESGEDVPARDWLEKAREESSTAGLPGVETLSRCHLAGLAGGDRRDAEKSFAANEDRLEGEDRLKARWLLWKASGDRAHLVEAKRLLDEAVANVPDDVRASMLANLRVNREIAAAAKAAGL